VAGPHQTDRELQQRSLDRTLQVVEHETAQVHMECKPFTAWRVGKIETLRDGEKAVAVASIDLSSQIVKLLSADQLVGRSLISSSNP